MKDLPLKGHNRFPIRKTVCLDELTIELWEELSKIKVKGKRVDVAEVVRDGVRSALSDAMKQAKGA